MRSRPDDLLGAHVSTQGGVAAAPARGSAIGATAIQVFTKTPTQWREPTLTAAQAAAFRAALAQSAIRAVVSHDSYLINLASPDDALRARSMRCFVGELARCRALGIPHVVSHPGNYIDDRAAGLDRNARAYAACLADVPGEVGVLIEGTAGAGTALGASFEELRALRDAMPAAVRPRIGFCLDTAHLHAAGYDVAAGIEEVWEAFDQAVGLSLLKCLHLNDSKAARGSRLDRHEWIAEGTIGAEPFRRIMRDPRFRPVVKIIETPKGDDPIRHDRRMLRRLRAYARARLVAPLASVLLALQGLAGGAVALAHASERTTAPAHVEAQHAAGCIVLHDALRCVLCQYAGSRVARAQARIQVPHQPIGEPRVQPQTFVPASRAGHLTAAPRAPPSLLS